MKNAKKMVLYYASIADLDDNFRDINSLYAALAGFVKEHHQFFTESINQLWGLDELIQLDYQEYTVEYVGFDLVSERMSIKNSIDYLSPGSLPMIIRDRLWELVTIFSDRECHQCGSAFRYARVIEENQNESIILDCTGCINAENLDGTSYKAVGKVRVLPVKKQEIIATPPKIIAIINRILSN